MFVFKRFKGKYYENLEVSKYPWISTIGNVEARIYGRYFLFYNNLKEQLKSYDSYKLIAEIVQPEENSGAKNNFPLSTIEDWLYKFKDKITDEDYTVLVSSLDQYFSSGSFPIISQKIKISGRVNKKLFGWHLNQIYRALGNGNLPKEYLLFAKQNISLFKDVAFDENNILGSNLYKYFTTKIQ